VMLNDRQDYFGQTVNIASRVQHLAVRQAIFASGTVVTDPSGSALLTSSGVEAVPHRAALRGISDECQVYEIPCRQRALRALSRPSGVRGPVLLPPWSLHRVLFRMAGCLQGHPSHFRRARHRAAARAWARSLSE
jgi:hypothetical protein